MAGKDKRSIDMHSMSTIMYITLFLSSFILGLLGWGAQTRNWFNMEKMFLLFRKVLEVDLTKCSMFCGIHFLLSLLGWRIDKLCTDIVSVRKDGKYVEEYNYDLNSTFWVTVSVIVGAICTIVIMPRLNHWTVIQKYGHEMGIMTDNWTEQGSLLVSIQRIIMYVICVPTVVILMRQWIRMAVNTGNGVLMVLIKAITFPLYPAAAIVLCYCMSELLAIGVIGAILFGILSLLGNFGQNVMNTREATRLSQSNDWYGIEIANEEVLENLAQNNFGQYSVASEHIAKEELEKRRKNR